MLIIIINTRLLVVSFTALRSEVLSTQHSYKPRCVLLHLPVFEILYTSSYFLRNSDDYDFIELFFSFTLYPSCSRLRRDNLVLRPSVRSQSINQLHAVSRTLQVRQREPSVKTLSTPLSAGFWRHCVLSGRTQRRACPRHQTEEIEI